MESTLVTTLPPAFEPWPKIARLSRRCIVTEKIDGTNASILVTSDGEVIPASRTRFISVADDNYGFAKWVKAHEDELREGLGIGTHFGEWWGAGIQRNYGMKEKVFSLFNTSRWNAETKPDCCRVVPILYDGEFATQSIDGSISRLAAEGSIASPGFMRPEGIVVYHVAANTFFKKTIEKDDAPKGQE